MTCKQDFEDMVKRTIKKARAYVDGLCLDCINSSQSKTSSFDDDYWRHCKLKGNEIVKGCRVKSHSQATWYFSFMGKRQYQKLSYFRHLHDEHRRRARREEVVAKDESPWLLDE